MFPPFRDRSRFDIQQTNILVSDDSPPRACLANFGSITEVLFREHRSSLTIQMGDNTLFMAPELLLPQKYGKKDGTPTTQADVYAFGLVIFQVCGQDLGVCYLLMFFL